MDRLKSNHITVETTNLCPGRCPVCPREKYEHKLQIMDMGLFKKIIDDATQYHIGVLDLCAFGEPFTDKLLFERCKYAKEQMPNLKIYISTTGYLMTRSTYDNVRKYIDILKIGFYGMTKNVYEKCHGNLKFETSLANIMGLLNEPGLPHTVGLLVITEDNESQIDTWINFWEPLLDEVMVWTPHNWAGLRNYRPLDHTKQRSCGRPFNGPIYIHVNGTVSPCCWDINRKLPIGNMNTDTIHDVLHSPSFKRIQAKHSKNEFVGLLCYECEQTNDFPGALIYSSRDRHAGQLTVTKGELCV